MHFVNFLSYQTILFHERHHLLLLSCILKFEALYTTPNLTNI